MGFVGSTSVLLFQHVCTGILCGITFCIVLYHNTFQCCSYYTVILCCIISYCVILCSIILSSHIELYYTVIKLYCIALYHVLLCHMIELGYTDSKRQLIRPGTFNFLPPLSLTCSEFPNFCIPEGLKVPRDK